MQLISLKYSQSFTRGRDDYFIDTISFNSSNLIVGKNATGKSRILSTIKALARMLGEEKRIYIGNWDVTFKSNKNETINYKMKFHDKPDNFIEELSIDGKILIDRNDTTAKIFSEKSKDFIEVNPPANKLIIDVRRDIVEFPYLELLSYWGEKTFYLDFGHLHAYSFLDETKKEKHTNTPDMGTMLHELSDESIEIIMRDFNSLEYNIDKLYAKKEDDKTYIFIKEEYLKYPYRHEFLSQGMYRTLHLLIFIEYLKSKKMSETMIIDDLCEGLDYSRATGLGKLIFDKVEDTDIQLFVSTNDYFLMNVVDINYWNVLYKQDNHTKSFNYSNSKDKFDEFKFSGLSNFDLLSSDYLAN
jgi:predicted ATPase